jgi:chromosome partitioning protein
MPTIAIVSQKGGSGKTTLALHLASCAAYAKLQSLVIDTDPQATASAWGDWRGEFLPEILTSPPARIGMTIRSAERRGMDFIVIDTPPHADAAMREAIKAADLVLIPTRPRAFDLHALETIADMVGYARKPAFAVLNAVPAGGTRVVAETAARIEDFGIKVCPVSLGERAAFHRSSAKGEVASEIEPDGKAAGEVSALWKWLRKQL